MKFLIVPLVVLSLLGAGCQRRGSVEVAIPVPDLVVAQKQILESDLTPEQKEQALANMNELIQDYYTKAFLRMENRGQNLIQTILQFLQFAGVVYAGVEASRSND